MIDRRLFLFGAVSAWAADAPAQPVGWDGHPPTNNPIHSPIAGKPYKPQAKKILPRPTISCLDNDERRKLFDSLEKAYDKLLGRAPGPNVPPAPVNPTSLLYHMWIHDYYCSGKVMDVHANWFFLPWHRAFLHFHERILQSVLGDDFRLPVWEWDRCNDVPSFYADWAGSRLKVQYSSKDLGGQITKGVLQAWLQSTETSNFLGGAQSQPHAMTGPHQLVHNTFGALMDIPQKAALDPLFYTHHANMDRFWEFWRKTTHAQETDADWLNQRFGFYDPDGTAVSIQVKDLLDLDSLGYFYPSMPDPDLIYPSRMVIQSGFDPHTKSVLFSKDELSPFLNAGTAVPCRIFGAPQHPKNGRYYLLGIRGATEPRGTATTRIIGGFGSFMNGRMSHNHVIANGCLEAGDLQFLVQNEFRMRLVWGPADSSGKAIAAGADEPFWPISKVELLLRTS
jgi:Common central domain of tyrosinase/Polyphenol oxidase middle domain